MLIFTVYSIPMDGMAENVRWSLFISKWLTQEAPMYQEGH